MVLPNAAPAAMGLSEMAMNDVLRDLGIDLEVLLSFFSLMILS